MDTRGNIYTEEMMQRLEAKDREKLTEIPSEWEEPLQRMNRKERRAWLSRHRRELRKGAPANESQP